VGARILALNIFDEQSPGPDFIAIQSRTGVSRSSAYKLRTKAISRGWIPENIAEPEHVDDTPRLGGPSQKELKTAWIKCWEDMPQEKIQLGLKGFLLIQEVITCQGVNLYKEDERRGNQKLEFTRIVLNSGFQVISGYSGLTGHVR
jgi:hypothetical protein